MFRFADFKAVSLALHLSEVVYLCFRDIGAEVPVFLTGKSEMVVEISFFNLLKAINIFFKKTTFRFNKVSDIVVYDRPTYALRYVVSYVLTNPDRELKVRLRLAVNAKNTILISISSLANSCGWAEREALDMFGLKFWGNKDSRRIIGDYGFWGFPGRKDFPLVGIYSYFYVINFLRVFRVRGILSDFWSIYFQKGVYNQC